MAYEDETIGRNVTMRRTGARPGELDVEIALVPVGTDQQTKDDTVLSLIVMAYASTKYASIDVVLPRDEPSSCTATVPLDDGVDASTPLDMLVLAFHGTRMSGMHRETI